ncbi:MAG: hypothetical protein MAG471_00397 [Acidimicrobiaceae bacterium]|nr:hypothetical protein [Acidimicrobiaceae bacterium]
MRRTGPLSAMLVVLVGLAAACGASESDQTRSIIVLTADEAPELVLPADAFLNVVETTTAPPATTVPTSLAPSPSASPSTTTLAAPSETASTTEPTKDTIPLAEEDPRDEFRSTIQVFNDCLSAEGFTFRGPPGEDSDEDDPVNQPGYVAAVERCNAESGVADAVEEFRASREERSPEQVRENNEQLLAVVACLRNRGWDVDEPTPDETGALSPRTLFRDAAEEVDGADIRECASEANLFGGGGGFGGGRSGAGQGGGGSGG